MNCLYCGKELTGRHQKKYCSVSCQKAHRSILTQKKRIRICEACGKEFIMHRPSGKARRGEVNEGRFCSRACHFAWVRQQPKKVKVKPEKVWMCVICGNEIKSYALYCSDECRKEKERRRYRQNAEALCLKKREAYEPKEKKERVCGICGCSFLTASRSASYCSDLCRSSARTGSKKARSRARNNGVFYEYVNPLKVFKRDGWRCQLCGKKLKPKHRGTIRDDAPELDHIIPWAQGGEHSYRNTQCTCRKCNQEKGARELGQLRLFG